MMIAVSLNTSLMEICLESATSLNILLVYAALNALLLPLFILVLAVGLRQWYRHGTLSVTSTSDLFTYNLALVEILGVFGAFAFTTGSWTKSDLGISLSFCLLVTSYVGRTLFHCEICLDRYFAIVHPITYRNLKEATVVCVRNISVALSWLLSVSWIALALMLYPDFPGQHLLGFFGIFIILVLYCCLSSLCVLIRPGPNGKKQIDQSKLTAFHIVLTITSLLFFQFLAFLVYLFFYVAAPLNLVPTCAALGASLLFICSVNALIPLLFLRRKKNLLH